MSVTDLGPYLVYERLGAGGMAVVHRAHLRGGGTASVNANTPIALKLLLPQLALMPEFVQAFLDEAKLAKQLRHPNVVQMYAYGDIEGTYYIAMEMVRGPTLAQVVKRGARAPMAIAAHLLAQICDALDYAHGLADADGTPLGIIHRDVSPSNVIISTDGAIKLIDFGIAKAATSSVRTKKGFIKGKFGYVAPEYVAGRIDRRVDVWGAGVIAHELLTGKKLFQVDNDMDTLQRVRSLFIEAPSRTNTKVPRALDDIIMKALRRDPDERYQHAREMRDALLAFGASLGRTPTPRDVAAWVETAMGPPPKSEASAVSIELDLIEAATTGIAGNRRRSRAPLAVLAVLAVVTVALAAYLALG
jgi:eukaryotic-like serine/threonine-protein kinase